MDIYEIIVTIFGILTIIWVIWFFFFPERQVKSAQLKKVHQQNIQEIDIKVKGGYDPGVIEIQKGIPTKINFYRDESDSCSARIIMSDFNITKELPAYKTTSVEFTPQKEGEYEFTCGMGMLKGKIIVK